MKKFMNELKTSWNGLNKDEQEGIKIFVVQFIMSIVIIVLSIYAILKGSMIIRLLGIMEITYIGVTAYKVCEECETESETETEMKTENQ